MWSRPGRAGRDPRGRPVPAEGDGPNEPPADDLPAFTLGAVNVSPMSMAEAYATAAGRGVSCTPVAVTSIVTSTGARLPVQKAHCHQAVPAGIADAANYILQSVLTVGTAAGLGIGLPAAGKTGTSDNFDYAAFGGYTPDRPATYPCSTRQDPVTHPMQGIGACYRITCDPGGMFGADAPAHTWQMTFEHAVLANPAPGFVMADIPPQLWSMGTGQNNPAAPKKTATAGTAMAAGTGTEQPRRRRHGRRTAQALAARRPGDLLTAGTPGAPGNS